jgi:hypothetical protein
LTTSKVSFSAAWGLLLITVLLFCCLTGLSAEPSIDENGLQVFLTGTLHGPAQVLVHKESHPTAPGLAYLSAILCRLQDERDVLLIVEVQNHHFKEVWSSLKIVKSLGVVSPRNLDFISSKEGEYFAFWGCNPHDCGGISGTYKFEIFSASDKSMLVLDVRQCASGGAPSNPARVRMCVTNLVDENAQIPLAAQHVLSKQIRLEIKGAENALVEF